GGPPGGDRRERGDRADGPAGGRGIFRRAAVRPRSRRADRRRDGGMATRASARGAGDPAHPGATLLLGLPRLPRAVRAREGLPAARWAVDRTPAVGRIRRRARAIHARDRRAPPAGGVLRDEV